MMFNSGQKIKEGVGAINHYGSDAFKAGITGDEYMSIGVATKAPLPHPDHRNCQSRKAVCGHRPEGKGKQRRGDDPAHACQSGSDITGTAQTIETELGAEASINTVITLAAWLSDADENAIQQSGATDRVKLASFDMNAADPTPTKAGTQTTAIDALSARLFDDNHACGKHHFGTDPVLTAP